MDGQSVLLVQKYEEL